MPTRTPLALAVAALSLASAGNALAGDPRQIDVLSGVWPSPSSAGAVDGNRSITIHGHRTETVDAAPADRDVQLKGQKILQNAPAAQEDGAAAAREPAARMTAAPGVREAYLQYRLEPARITSYSMSGDGSPRPKGGTALQNAAGSHLPPTSPASAGALKLDGIDPKAAIAINTPLRTLPSRSADGSGGALMKLETLPRPAPGFGAPVGRR